MRNVIEVHESWMRDVMRHDSCTLLPFFNVVSVWRVCATHVCDMTHVFDLRPNTSHPCMCVWHVCVTHLCDTPHVFARRLNVFCQLKCVWHVCVTRMCDMTHAWHDALTYLPWSGQTLVPNYFALCSVLQCIVVCCSVLHSSTCGWNDLFMCNMTHVRSTPRCGERHDV